MLFLLFSFESARNSKNQKIQTMHHNRREITGRASNGGKNGQPTDGISSVVFGKSIATARLLLSSSWDGGLRVYDVEEDRLVAEFSRSNPLLDCTFGKDNDGALYSCGMSGEVYKDDLNSPGGGTVVIGKHDKAVRCLRYLNGFNSVATGSWDKTVKIWDCRQSPTSSKPLTCHLPEKVFAMAACGATKLIVGTNHRHVRVYDLRKMTSEAEQQRISSLVYQTRCIRAFPNGQGYALSSIEGRVAIEYLDPNPKVQEKKYAFKAHRRMENSVDTSYPINSIAFHPTYGTFATGACDGFVYVWDADAKKKILQLPQFPASISSMDFNLDGSKLAVASSYTFERGVLPPNQQVPDATFVLDISDADVRPKSALRK